MREIEASADVIAEPPEAFRVFTDVSNWPRWAGVKEVVIRQPGDPVPEGLGSIRVIRTRGVAIEEEVTSWEAPKRLVTRISAGAALRFHEAEVRFEASPAGTRIRWTMRLRPLLPLTGRLIAGALRRRMEDILQRLGRRLS